MSNQVGGPRLCNSPYNKQRTIYAWSSRAASYDVGFLQYPDRRCGSTPRADRSDAGRRHFLWSNQSRLFLSIVCLDQMTEAATEVQSSLASTKDKNSAVSANQRGSWIGPILTAATFDPTMPGPKGFN